MKTTLLRALALGYTLRREDNSSKIWMEEGVVMCDPADLPLSALNEKGWICELGDSRLPDNVMRACLERLMYGQNDEDRKFEALDVQALTTLMDGLSVMTQHKGLTVR
jgi:hypothetical protein